MTFVRLIYASRFTDEINAKELQAIVEISRKKNPGRAITGALCYGPGLFLQAIEGPRPEVNMLYRDIVNDSRNRDVTLLEYSETDHRLFEKWSMAYVRADNITQSIIKAYCGTSQFDPFAMKASQAVGFIRDLVTETEAFREMVQKSKP